MSIKSMFSARSMTEGNPSKRLMEQQPQLSTITIHLLQALQSLQIHRQPMTAQTTIHIHGPQSMLLQVM